MRTALQTSTSVLTVLLLAGCVTDAATRLAYDIEHGAAPLAVPMEPVYAGTPRSLKRERVCRPVPGAT